MHLKVNVFFAVKFVMTRIRLHHWQRNAIVDWAERLSKVVLSARFTFVNSVLKISITIQSRIFLSAVLALIITVRPVETKVMDCHILKCHGCRRSIIWEVLVLIVVAGQEGQGRK